MTFSFIYGLMSWVLQFVIMGLSYIKFQIKSMPVLSVLILAYFSLTHAVCNDPKMKQHLEYVVEFL